MAGGSGTVSLVPTYKYKCYQGDHTEEGEFIRDLIPQPGVECQGIPGTEQEPRQVTVELPFSCSPEGQGQVGRGYQSLRGGEVSL